MNMLKNFGIGLCVIALIISVSTCIAGCDWVPAPASASSNDSQVCVSWDGDNIGRAGYSDFEVCVDKD